MKKNYILILILLFYSISSIAQQTQSNFINYQGVARNAENQLMANETMVVGIELKIGGASEAPTYSENHSITTDANGVFSLKIGNGDLVSGDYNNFSWGDWATFVSVSINGTAVGTTEMTAVPYALSSGDGAQQADEVPYNNALSGLAANNTQEAIDELVGSGTIDADSDATNELQNLNFDATTNELSLSDGNTVIIPSGGTDGDADATNEIQTISFDAASNELSLTDGGTVTIPSGGTDGDADSTNELQTLAFDAGTNELSLSDGNSITIPNGGAGGTDDQNAAEVPFDNSASGLAATNAQTAIDELASSGLVDTDDQNADEVPFDNTASGLAANNTQTAIDELASSGLVDTDDQNAAEVPFDNSTSTLTATNTQTALEELAAGGTVDTDNQALVLTGDILTIEDGAGSIDLSTYKDDTNTTSQTGILLGDGTAVTGLEGTADGQIPKWDAATSTWAAGTDETGTGGSAATGLEAIDEGNGNGWRLIGRDPANYLSIGENAVDLSVSIVDLDNSPSGATGSRAIAMGYKTNASGIVSAAMGANTSASGFNATAMGNYTRATGDFSTVMGRGARASGELSTAMGRNTNAIGEVSMAMGSNTNATGNISTALGLDSRASGENSLAVGLGTIASTFNSTAVGTYNVPRGNATSWVPTDPIFDIGIGLNEANRENALTVLKNGNVGIGWNNPPEAVSVRGKVRVTSLEGSGTRNVKADGSGNLIIGSGGSGLEAINEGNGTGWRLAGSNPANYGNIGRGAVDLSTSLITSEINGATSNFSVAMGYDNVASELGSVAIGISNQATGSGTVAMGSGTIANKYRSMVIGANNISEVSSDSWIPNESLFVIGNGTGHLSRSNALTVLKNGNTGIGTHIPTSLLHVFSNSTALNSPQIRIEEDGTGFARFELTNSNAGFWHLAGFNGATTADDRFNIYNSAAGNIVSVRGDGDMVLQGSLSQNSDRRLKRDIEALPYGLETIMQLAPKAYYWKKDKTNDQKSLGLIAQEVQSVIKEVVQGGTSEEEMLSISYTELVPVLIKAMQEQQELIINLQNEQRSMLTQFGELKSQMDELVNNINKKDTAQRK